MQEGKGAAPPQTTKFHSEINHWLVDLKAAAAARTSSSLGRMSGSGPIGVMLYNIVC